MGTPEHFVLTPTLEVVKCKRVGLALLSRLVFLKLCLAGTFSEKNLRQHLINFADEFLHFGLHEVGISVLKAVSIAR